jgi:hypothetical protein
MKYLFLFFPLFAFCQDSIRQEVLKLPTGTYGLVTSDRELYDSVIFGTREFIESRKIVEFQAAMRRRKATHIIKAICK